MGRNRQRWVSKRVAISVIALYAFLLQGFLAAAAQASAFDSLGNITCSPQASDPAAPPSGDRDHCHSLCCILACVASGCAYLATASGFAVFPPRMATPIVWTSRPRVAARSPQRFYFAARGPPLSA
jgi:hypothetical protein